MSENDQVVATNENVTISDESDNNTTLFDLLDYSDSKLIEIFYRCSESINKIYDATVIIKGYTIEKYKAGEIFYSNYLLKHKGLPISYLTKILCQENGESISKDDSLSLYNNWLLPIWNNLSGITNRVDLRHKKDYKNVLLKTKEELLSYFWVMYICLQIPELNPGIILRKK